MTRNPRIPRQWIVGALLRVYPRAWRLEYGDELTGVLLARPLGTRAIADVLWNGLRQRAKIAEPSTILGVASILVIVAGFALGDSIFGSASQWKFFPAVGVSFLVSGIFALFFFVCGCWTQLRHGGEVHRSGLAAMRTALIAGIPIVLAALLMMLGLADLRLPGSTLPLPSPVVMLFAPLTRLPDAWLWGFIGGKVGKQIRCWQQPAAATRP